MKLRILKHKTATTLLITTTLFGITYGTTLHHFHAKEEVYKHKIKLKNNKINSLNQTIIHNNGTIKLKENRIIRLQNKLNKVIQQLNEQKENNLILKSENEKLKRENERKLETSQKVSGNNQLNMVVTAYTPYCTEGCTGLTKTEYDVSNTIYYQGMRIVAADPNIIPLYSIIQINLRDQSFKAIVLDTGGAIVSNKLDLLVSDTETALNFGKQNAVVTILREGRG